MSDAEEEEPVSVYDEVEIEDMTFDEALQIYHHPCPCGDRFEIALADLQDETTDIAVCPSCSLMIRVIYDVVRCPLSLWFAMRVGKRQLTPRPPGRRISGSPRSRHPSPRRRPLRARPRSRSRREALVSALDRTSTSHMRG